MHLELRLETDRRLTVVLPSMSFRHRSSTVPSTSRPPGLNPYPQAWPISTTAIFFLHFFLFIYIYSIFILFFIFIYLHYFPLFLYLHFCHYISLKKSIIHLYYNFPEDNFKFVMYNFSYIT